MFSDNSNMRKLGDYQFDTKYLLGEGAFGKVYKGKKISTNEDVAIKKIDSSMVNKDQYLIDALNSEVKIMKQLDHPNIVKFIDKFNTDRSIYIVTEFCADGDLRNMMKGRRIPENEVTQIFCQLASGFRELVKANIIHRDLKPANIMNHKGQVKIADFGFAKVVDNFGGELLRTCVGSPLYMAPQILKKERYTTKCDIWSLGIIYYEMIYGLAPWTGYDEKSLTINVMKKQLTFPQTVQISDFSKNFILKTLEKDENKRIEWNELFDLFEQQKRTNPQQHIDFKMNGNNSYILDQPPIIKKQQSQPQNQFNDALQQQFLGQMQNINQKRMQLNFSHFVNVLMTQHIATFNQHYKKELQFELLCLLSIKLVSQSFKILQSKVSQTLEQNSKTLEYLKYVSNFQNESQLAQEFLQDTVLFFDRTGLLSNLKSIADYSQYIDVNDLTINQLLSIEKIIKERIQIIVKHILQSNEKNKEYELLNVMDLMLEMCLTRAKLMNQVSNIDYSLIYEKKNSTEYQTQIQYKLNEVYNY